MNVTLSQPIVTGAEWNQGSFPPLGLLYLAASLKNIDDVHVQIVDGFCEGLTVDENSRRILETTPDLVGMSITSSNFLEGLEVLRLVKEKQPHILTVCGGVHASLFDDLILEEHDEVDFILRGEGEESLRALVNHLITGTDPGEVKGLSRRVNGTIIRGVPQIVDNLDTLAHPDRSLLTYDGYGSQWYGFRLPSLPKMTTAFTSRGCPHRCLFCSNSVMNRTYRVRSPENILEELIELDRQGYKFVIFFDDNLTAHVDHMNKLCRLIISQRLQMKFGSTCMPYLLPDETLALMNRAGFIFMFVGVESGSDAILKRYRKPGTRNQLIDGIRRAQQANILVIASFIAGYRHETSEDHEASKDLLLQARPVFSEINPLMVHPGSELWDEIHKDGQPTELNHTRSRLISRFDGQLDKPTIQFRLGDFRKTFQGLWKQKRMLWKAFTLLRKNKLFFPLVKPLFTHPAVVFQLARGGKER